MLELMWNILIFVIIGCGMTFVPVILGNLFISVFKAPYEKITLMETAQMTLFSWVGFVVTSLCAFGMISTYIECTNFWVKCENMSVYKILNKLFTFGE